MRRVRRQQVVEMLHMAKRPFASVAVILNTSQQPETNQATKFADIRPLAIEPTSNAIAAVTTVLIKLPDREQTSSGTRLTLGSTLVLNMHNQRGCYTNVHRHHHCVGGSRQRRNVPQ